MRLALASLAAAAKADELARDSGHDLGRDGQRAELIPYRTRYLRLLNELGRRTLDTQRDWLEHVEQQLGQPTNDRTRHRQP